MTKASVKIVEPDRVVVRLECEAPVEVWRKVAEALRQSQKDAWDIRVTPLLHAVCDAVSLADERFVGLAQSERDDTQKRDAQ